MTIVEALQAIKDAVLTVDGVGFFNIGEAPHPPCVVADLPSLGWTGGPYNTSQPNTATFLLFLCVPMDVYVLSNLEPLVLSVTEAIYNHIEGAVFTDAVPGTFSGPTNMPCYVMTCEVNL